MGHSSSRFPLESVIRYTLTGVIPASSHRAIQKRNVGPLQRRLRTPERLRIKTPKPNSPPRLAVKFASWKRWKMRPQRKFFRIWSRRWGSKATTDGIVEPDCTCSGGFRSSCARKLRDRKPSLFNAFEIFDRTGYRMAPVFEVKQEILAYNLVVE
jgi:hypothetical protein